MVTIQGTTILAECPDCQATMGFQVQSHFQKNGVFPTRDHYSYNKRNFDLLMCPGCGRGAFVDFLSESINHDKGPYIIDFFPYQGNYLPVSLGTPDDITSEFREAETCSSAGTYRAASAMLRSTLTKVLEKNGYVDGGLEQKINDARTDGIITEARGKLVHKNVRVLGNDVLHDEWRKVTEEEYELGHLFTQRVIEDFYSDRQTVEEILVSKNRIKELKQPKTG